jgi:hypothetical protein
MNIFNLSCIWCKGVLKKVVLALSLLVFQQVHAAGLGYMGVISAETYDNSYDIGVINTINGFARNDLYIDPASHFVSRKAITYDLEILVKNIRKSPHNRANIYIIGPASVSSGQCSMLFMGESVLIQDLVGYFNNVDSKDISIYLDLRVRDHHDVCRKSLVQSSDLKIYFSSSQQSMIEQFLQENRDNANFFSDLSLAFLSSFIDFGINFQKRFSLEDFRINNGSSPQIEGKMLDPQKSILVKKNFMIFSQYGFSHKQIIDSHSTDKVALETDDEIPIDSSVGATNELDPVMALFKKLLEIWIKENQAEVDESVVEPVVEESVVESVVEESVVEPVVEESVVESVVEESVVEPVVEESVVEPVVEESVVEPVVEESVVEPVVEGSVVEPVVEESLVEPIIESTAVAYPVNLPSELDEVTETTTIDTPLLRTEKAKNEVKIANTDSAAKIKSARVKQTSKYVKLVFDIIGEVNYNIITLEDPHRIVIDIFNTKISSNLDNLDFTGTQINKVRSAVRNSKDSRIVLDLNAKVNLKHYTLTGVSGASNRLVLELGASEIASVRLISELDNTKLVFDINGVIDHDIILLQDPHRLVVDISNVSNGITDLDIDLEGTPIKQIRSAKKNVNDIRYVLDLKYELKIKEMILEATDKYSNRIFLQLFHEKKSEKVTKKSNQFNSDIKLNESPLDTQDQPSDNLTRLFERIFVPRADAKNEQIKMANSAKVQAANEQAAIDQPSKEQAVREQAAREQIAKEQAVQEQAAREQAAREQAAREQAAREQAAREQAVQEQAAREQAAKEQAVKEQAAREQAAREQADKELAAREQAVTAQEKKALEISTLNKKLKDLQNKELIWKKRLQHAKLQGKIDKSALFNLRNIKNEIDLLQNEIDFLM